MKLIISYRNKLLTGCILISLLAFCSSCMYDKEYIKYTNDQINLLKSTTEELKASTESKIDIINSNHAAILVEIEALRADVRDLAGRVEDNENMIQHAYKKELGEKEGVGAEVTRLIDKINQLERMVNHHHEYLNLEPFIATENDNGAGVPNNEAVIIDPGDTASASKPQDVVLYESNLELFNNEKYERALKGFKSFIDAFPKSDLADNAQFWIGECLMSLKQYKPAILAFQEVIKNYPNENKVPNAMLRQAIAMLEIGDPTSTKIILEKLLEKYPTSPESEIARKKLISLK